jgi:PAS domain S-box-containing protein
MLVKLPEGGAAAAQDFLSGGGEMGARMRAKDWSASPLGEPASWPQSLRTLVRLMLNAKQAMFIAWGPKLAFLYNDAYAPIFGAKHPHALGRPFAEVWSDIWSQIEPLVDSTISGESVWQEDLLIPMERNGYREDAYFTFSYTPVHDESGVVSGMFCAVTETTGKVFAERQVATERERLRELFHQAPGFMAMLLGREHTFEMVNNAYYQLVGHREILGKPVREALPEVAGQGFHELLDTVYESGEAFVGDRIPVDLLREPGSCPEKRFVNFVYQPIRDSHGRIFGVFAAGHDVTEARRAEEHQELLINELNHRVKNTLATVQSIISQTLRNARTTEEARLAAESRLFALSRAHDVLTQENWGSADLRQVVAEAMAPFRPERRERLRTEGPSVRVPPRMALAIAMALQELATNAVKYGALSNDAGGVRIQWSLVDGEPPRLGLVWSEEGGPPVGVPTRRGFGTRLIERSLAHDLDGRADIRFEPTGLICAVDAPLRPAEGSG